MTTPNLGSALQRGMILFEQGRYKEAGDFFRTGLAGEPENPELLFNLAVCEFRLDRNSEALEILSQALALAPENPGIFIFRAFVLTAMHRLAEATTSAAEAIRLDANNPDAHAAMANVHLSKQEWKLAETSSREALSLDPDHEGAASMLAVALRLQNRLSESGDQVAHMLSQNPESGDNHTNAGWVSLQKGDQKQAENHFLEALRLDPENEYAKSGLKESFKARSPIYRAYLSYCFFMQRFTEGKQWMLIIGFLLVTRVARSVLPPALAVVVMALYYLFVLWVHVAGPVGNLQLFFDSKARHALDTEEKWEAWMVGGGVVAGLLFLGAGLGLGIGFCFVLGIGLIGLAFPLRYVFTNPSLKGRIVFSSAAGTVVMAVLVNVLPESISPFSTTLQETFASIGILVVVVSTWLSSIPTLRRA